MSDYYKEGYFYRKQSPKWEVENYGEAVDGKGDLIFNTLEYIISIIEDPNSSEAVKEWAYTSFTFCGWLLGIRQRWPNPMNQDCDANNWVRWRWSQFLQWITSEREWNNETKQLDRINTRRVKFRPQGFMTRDPYYPFYYLCVKYGRKDLIKEVKIPWYLYRREVWRDRRRLIQDNSKDFVKKIRYYRDKTNVLNYEKIQGNIIA